MADSLRCGDDDDDDDDVVDDDCEVCVALKLLESLTFWYISLWFGSLRFGLGTVPARSG